MKRIFYRKSFEGNFMIFAHARSGSTNLSNILESHEKINIAGEPFHDEYLNWHPEDVKLIIGREKKKQVERSLTALYTKYNGIKTLMRHLNPSLNKYMILSSGLKVIYLCRSNLLQTAVSVFISGQSNIWYKRVDQENNPLKEFRFNTISLEAISKELNKMEKNRKFYENVLKKKNNNDLFKIKYEDLYFSDSITKSQLIHDLFRFLGYEYPEKKAIDLFLDPEKSKMNSFETYRKIPNIDEIEEKFGNNETGWLFK